MVSAVRTSALFLHQRAIGVFSGSSHKHRCLRGGVVEVAWLPQGWECSPLNVGFSGWGWIVVLLVTLGDTGRELLLLFLLGHQAALNCPLLTCGIFPSHHHYQSPISMLGKEDSTSHLHTGNGSGGAPCSGLVPCAPHSKSCQQAAVSAPQHPACSK